MRRPTGACAQGKHDICPGQGFDHDKRERIECTCECHGATERCCNGDWRGSMFKHDIGCSGGSDD